MKKITKIGVVIALLILMNAILVTNLAWNTDKRGVPIEPRIGYNSADMVPWAGTGSIPTGFLECNGQAVSRSTYSLLFSTIGTTYGSGDGSTTFNVPDVRQKFIMGVAASGTGSTLGATGGTIDHVHSVDPPNTTSTAAPNITNVTLLALGSAAQPSHTHDVNIAAFNSASANPPFLAIRWIIKT